MSYTFEEISLDEVSDSDLGPLLERINDMNREMQPRSVDLTTDELRMFSHSPGTVLKRWLARDTNGTVVGSCETRHREDGTNPDSLRFQIRVWPEFRRLGAGSAMLAKVCETAAALERSQLLTMHFDTIPAGAEFARAFGGEEKLQFHENVLRIADLDPGLMERWVRHGESRAEGYSVTVTEGEWPEDLMEDIARLHFVLERDMPLSEGQEPRQWTADLVRELQDQYKDGIDALFAMAFHDETGRAVGMSELIRRRTDPTTWIVTVTMVDPEHRGKSIGKWLKGAVNLAALKNWPGGVYQETGNAFTNDAMLAINHAMGFEHELTITDVAIGREDAGAYVAFKGYRARAT